MKTFQHTLLASVAAGALAFSVTAASAQTATQPENAAEQPVVVVPGAEQQPAADAQIQVETPPASATAVGGGRIVVDPQDPQVTVRQDDPTVTVDQAAPEVTVEQPQPEISVVQQKPTVNVRQQAPIVTVEQAQPIVTVRIPEPIVTVRLPKPEVDVNTSQPQVAVETPEPIVRFVRPEPRITIEEAQPEVRIEEAEPQVAVNEADAARVSVEQAEAQVDVSSAGEAEVNVTRAQPQVSVESADEAQVNVEQADAQVRVQQAEGAEVNVDREQAAVAVVDADQTDREQTAVVAREVEAQPQVATARTNVAVDNAYLVEMKRSPFYRMRVADLIGAEVFGSQGEEVGNVEDIALRNGRVVAILSVGGFLGLGDHDVAMPLERLTMQGDNVVVQGMTEDQLEALPEYDYRSVTALPKRRTIEYSLTRR